jgi:hypothetical protein
MSMPQPLATGASWTKPLAAANLALARGGRLRGDPGVHAAEQVRLELLLAAVGRDHALADQLGRQRDREVAGGRAQRFERIEVEALGVELQLLLADRRRDDRRDGGFGQGGRQAIDGLDDVLERLLLGLAGAVDLVPLERVEIQGRLRRGDVQQPDAVDRIDARRAQVFGGLQDDVDVSLG